MLYRFEAHKRDSVFPLLFMSYYLITVTFLIIKICRFCICSCCMNFVYTWMAASTVGEPQRKGSSTTFCIAMIQPYIYHLHICKQTCEPATFNSNTFNESEISEKN